MATGNTCAAKLINTMNIMHNGGGKLEPELRAYVGDLLAEEEFEASQPNRPPVRRDFAGEMKKIPLRYNGLGRLTKPTSP